jgi:hypothetical protein
VSDLIPAAPGWYLETAGDLEPVIAWTPAIDSEGKDTLLPFVPDNRGITPWLVTEDFIKKFNGKVVYLPNHDPATDV